MARHRLQHDDAVYAGGSANLAEGTWRSPSPLSRAPLPKKVPGPRSDSRRLHLPALCLLLVCLPSVPISCPSRISTCTPQAHNDWRLPDLINQLAIMDLDLHSIGNQQSARVVEAEQSRAEQSRAEQSRAEQSRAEQSRAEQDRAVKGRVGQGRAGHAAKTSGYNYPHSRIEYPAPDRRSPSILLQCHLNCLRCIRTPAV